MIQKILLLSLYSLYLDAFTRSPENLSHSVATIEMDSNIYKDIQKPIVSSKSNAFSVATFHSLSLYWSPKEGDLYKKVYVEYREIEKEKWKNGYPMQYNPISKKNLIQMQPSLYDNRIDKLAMSSYRGSLVDLKPDKKYEIRLKLENSNEITTFKAHTWSEEFSIQRTIKVPSSHKSYYINNSGEKRNYILYDGSGSTIDASNKNSANVVIKKGVHHIIVRGLKLKNGDKSGIILEGDNHDIVIERCDISNWGRVDKNDGGNGFGTYYDSAIMVDKIWLVSNINRLIIQRNRIHNPRYSSNDWSQKHGDTYHPNGPQAITLGQSVRGNNVIRYNEIYAGENRCFNDIMSGYANGSYTGFPGSDSDIYGNYFSGACDDVIEAEGNDINVRIWNNYITDSYQGIGNAIVSVGPLYIWKNIFAKSTNIKNGKYGGYAAAIKFGYTTMENVEDFMDGYTYFFNNTILQEHNDGFSGIGIGNHHVSQIVRHLVARNNILQGRKGDKILSISNDNYDYHYDYDLLNQTLPEKHEKHGIRGIASYKNLYFNQKLMVGDFRLSSKSLGFDSGEILPNFTDNFKGNAPDIGAHEYGDEKTMSFGVNSSI